MAGNWDRDRGGEGRGGGDERRRRSAIFNDDHGRSHGGDRGFFERATEGVRSWLGGYDERQRGGGGYDRSEPWGGGDWAGERGGDARSSPSHYGREHGFGGFQGDYGGGQDQGGFGGRGDWQGGRQSFSSRGSTGSLHDDHYRSWRDRQIEQMDRDYEEYCWERSHHFPSDFDSWRRSRQAGGSALGASASTGSSGSLSTVSEESGAASADGGGTSGTGGNQTKS